MRIAVMGDIHSPTYLDLFKSSFLKIAEPDLLLLAGDICDVNEVAEYKNILEIIEKCKCPIIGVFGNTESRNSESNIDYKKIKRICGKRIKILQEEVFKAGKEIGIVGSKGVFDKFWPWLVQRRPDIGKLMKDRMERIKSLLENLDTDIKILLLHHPPTFKTMIGENPKTFHTLGSRKMEKVILGTKPDLVVHAHAHNGTKFAFVDSVPIYNVSLPLNRKIVEIDLKKLPEHGPAKFA